MTARDERLIQFFGGYFHQDWDIEGASSWRDVIAQYAKQVPAPQVQQISEDLRDWLTDSAADENENLPPAFACDYDTRSEGMTDRQWVQQVVNELDRLTGSRRGM